MAGIFLSAAISSLVFRLVLADACPNTLKPKYGAPVVAGGWAYQVVANGFIRPRGIAFDQNGALLVIDSGAGIIRLGLADDGGTCVGVANQTTIVNSADLNHGIALSSDGKTLYASTSNEVFAWSYDAVSGSVSGDNRTLITNMTNSDHTTRTLLLSQRSPGTILVSRGSNSNEDSDATDLSSGHSQIKAFNISSLDPNATPYEFTSQGTLLGWGLRNSVGVAEEPLTGGIWSVENSVDDLQRNGVDIHQDNPGEELNFHGFLNGSTQNQGGNYGYPDCYALWSTANFPDLGSLKTGSQFAPTQSSTVNDTSCNTEYVAPRLTFQAHTAPLDIKFASDGSQAFITFHGSWDRDEPIGYKLSSIAFSNGSPVEPSDSTSAEKDILSNADLSVCPGQCFRPVGLAIDKQGRLFMSSDATGEIYVLTGTDFAATDSPSGTSKDAESWLSFGIHGILLLTALVTAVTLFT